MEEFIGQILNTVKPLFYEVFSKLPIGKKNICEESFEDMVFYLKVLTTSKQIGSGKTIEISMENYKRHSIIFINNFISAISSLEGKEKESLLISIFEIVKGKLLNI